jgi:hypothetical protein
MRLSDSFFFCYQNIFLYTTQSSSNFANNNKQEKKFTTSLFVFIFFLGSGKSHNDAASVRTAHPIPAACGLYYFEVKIISKGRDGYMGIGLTAQNFKVNRLPGIEFLIFKLRYTDYQVKKFKKNEKKKYLRIIFQVKSNYNYLKRIFFVL